MPFTKFTNLDFDQIRSSIKDYLRANSTFTDFDFEGSNFSILIDTLAYNTYITAFNSNLVVNESFLDSATVRENVVSLARNIGYVPQSRKSSSAIVSFNVSVDPIQTNPVTYTPTLTLQSGLVCTGSASGTSYVFSIPESYVANVVDGVASFTNVTIYEGTFLRKQFTVNGSLDQRFILDNSYIDTSSIRVYVRKSGESGLGTPFEVVENIFEVNSSSNIFLIQEVQDEKYEILFGDGIFGEKLENDSVITVTYIVTDGKNGNGVSSFAFAGNLKDSDDISIIPNDAILINTIQNSQNGSDIESVDSIKAYAPRLYASQYRAVTPSDYETLIKTKIYPNTESVSVVGGEELDPPQYGKVFISIKPQGGTYVSDFNKSQIKSKLQLYSVSGINVEIVDIKILYVEIDSSVYYESSKVNSVEDLKSRVISTLNSYASSSALNSFGGRFKYSKVLQVIDNVDTAITSNITKVRIRRDLVSLPNQYVQYELCFGNRFHVNENEFNIKSTGFKILGQTETLYFTDTPNADKVTGIISIVRQVSDTEDRVVVKSAGEVNYQTGEIRIGPINITSTSQPNNIIQIQAYPESNDIIGLRDLYLNFSVSESAINMVKDVISSGEEVSGTLFSRDYYSSSYSNGNLIRK